MMEGRDDDQFPNSSNKRYGNAARRYNQRNRAIDPPDSRLSYFGKTFDLSDNETRRRFKVISES